MKLTFFGAAGEVTGSNFLLDTGKHKVLVDCGSHQGQDEEKHEDDRFPYDPAEIDALLLTHAHIDHSGRIPFLVKSGFKGKIFCTGATADLTAVLLRDSARIISEDAEWKTRKNMRRGLPPVEPLYNEEDVEAALEHFTPLDYYKEMEIMPGTRVRFNEAGHILGSSIIEVWTSENGCKAVKVVFSGDLGPLSGVIEKPPVKLDDADFVLIESTYGDRNHKSLEDTRSEFRDSVKAALNTSSKILVPTFIVDRAQRILYEFDIFQKANPGLKMPTIYFDSPMGIKTTEIYSKHEELLADDLRAMLKRGDDPFEPENFRFVRTTDDSRALNEMKEGIILAGSGMCTGGRIMHHLKHNLFKKDAHVFFVGYQAYGTLGRRLVDGAKEIRIAGEDVHVNAKFHTLNGFSAHAGRDDLLEWASSFPKGTRFIVIHGEPKSAQALALGLKDRGYNAMIPAIGDETDLLAPAPEKQVMPAVSPRILGHLGVTAADITQTLSAITTVSEEMHSAILHAGNYRDIMPLLISARTLLETARRLSEKKE